MTKAATRAQRQRWSDIIELGCIVGPVATCGGRLTIHHCGTGAGGRKDHDKVICLCWNHHQGKYGIDGKQIFTKKSWQAHYGTETELIEETERRLTEGVFYSKLCDSSKIGA